MKNDKLIAILILGGAAAWYFMNQTPPLAPQYSNIPPPPPPKSPNFQVWVDAIIKSFGNLPDLWKPGGPFYKLPVPTTTV